MAVGADTWGLEAVPPKKGDKVFYGHATLLKENGIYILEEYGALGERKSQAVHVRAGAGQIARRGANDH